MTLTLAAVIGSSLASRGFARHLDSRYLFLAGRLWSQGDSPYDAPTLHAEWRRHMEIPTRSVFLYPPTVALFAIPVARLPWPAARWVFDALGAACTAACLGLCALLLADGRRAGLDSWRPWAGLWLAALVSAIPGSLFIGQPTSIAVLGCLGALWCQRRGRPWATAGFALLATVKPHVSLFPLLYVLLTGGARPLIAAAGAAAAIAVAVVAPSAGLGVVQELRESLAAYATWNANAPDRLVGGYHWLATWAPTLPPHLLPLLGALLLSAAVLWRRPELRARGREERLLWAAAPFVAAALFAPLHGYDLAVLLLPVAAVPVLRASHALLLAPAVALVLRPDALERALGLEFEAASLGILYAGVALALVLTRLCLRPRPGDPPAAAPSPRS